MVDSYAFELSGEHPTLPRSEALALSEIGTSGFRVVRSQKRCLVVEAQNLDPAWMISRLAMTHRVIRVLAITGADLGSVAEAAKDLALPDKRYRIREKRMEGSSPASNEVEKAVGEVLWERGYRADLEDPEIDLRAIITGDEVVLGEVAGEVDRGDFETRRPHLKPFFHPGAILPRIARALVNLSRVVAGEKVLDPFSGTGGFLVEAGLMGMRGVGVDVQEWLVRGAESNLAGLNCDLVVGDAMRLPIRDSSIEGAVSDAPYGRSALVRAGSREELLTRSMEELHRVLIPGRMMVFVNDRPVGDMLIDAGFEVTEVHVERIHRSLTRHIFVCRR
jgi:Predicted DNA modification methylase